MIVISHTSDSVVIDAPAKVNLFLEVLNKRPDGYHNINSVFQAVSLFDRLHFSLTSQPGVEIELKGNVELSVGEDNLIARAYRLIQDKFDIDKGLHVFLEKHIPVAAGLAGGSADGAATLLACNLLYNLGVDKDRLSELALELGSDLPFFFTSGQAWVTGRGEEIREIDLPLDYRMVLVTPPIAVSTASSYRALKRDLTKTKTPFSLESCRTVDDLVGSLRFSGNDFEEVHLQSFPELGRIKEGLVKAGALLVRLTGSGPTMFGIYGETASGEVNKRFNRGDWLVHTVKPITLAG